MNIIDVKEKTPCIFISYADLSVTKLAVSCFKNVHVKVHHTYCLIWIYICTNLIYF